MSNTWAVHFLVIAPDADDAVKIEELLQRALDDLSLKDLYVTNLVAERVN